MMTGAEYVLTVKNLVTSFPVGSGWKPVVNKVSFSIKAGETLGVLGESGCGKSMLALSLMGLVPSPGVVAGRILFQGHDLLAAPALYNSLRGRRMSMIFQEPRSMFNPLLTVGQHFREILRWHLKMKRRDAELKAMELLGEVGLGSSKGFLELYPHELSGGTLQRVLISLALCCGPELVVADEPATALDMTVQAQVMEYLRRFRDKNGQALMLITHDLGIIRENCERVLVMYAGEVVETGPVQAVYSQPAHPYTEALLNIYQALSRTTGVHLRPIPGQVPEFGEKLTDCPFAPRCGYKTVECTETRPVPVAVGPEHMAACHRAGRGRNG